MNEPRHDPKDIRNFKAHDSCKYNICKEKTLGCQC